MKSYGRSLNINDLKTNLPNGIRYFSEGTSFHGFHELYHAKTCFWRLFWFLVCGSACALTGYQVYLSIMQYVQQSTTTLISPAQENEILYPPLSLCFWQWFYWVDWKKAMSYNYTRETILYGFSFYNTIYSTTDFDAFQAKENFTKMMTENNFTTLSQYYLAVARDVPITADNNQFKTYFEHRQIVYNDPYHLFCYQVSEQQMRKFFIQNQNDDGTVMQKIITFNTYDESYANFSQSLTADEYNYYMTTWANKFSMYRLIANTNDQQHITSTNAEQQINADFTKFAPPKILILFSNIDKGAELQVENDQYQIDMKSSVFTWQNKINKPCKEGNKSIASNQTCQDLCTSKYESTACSCQMLDSAFRIKNDTVKNVCNKGMNFLSGKNNTHGSMQICSTDFKLMAVYYDCLNSCLSACQVWNYEKTTTIKTSSNILRSVGVKSSTIVRIEYPMGKDIVIMTETEDQSWEDFIGNVGGLLGIWTGASILSFVQLFYLCFCSDSEGCPATSIWLENILKPKQNRTNIVHIRPQQQVSAVNSLQPVVVAMQHSHIPVISYRLKKSLVD